VTLLFALVLVLLGVVGAFVAGLLGVGGAIVMIPLLLYVPSLLGVGVLDAKAVSGVTMTQVFVAAVSGMIAHRRRRVVNTELARTGGLAMAAGSLVGSLASKHASAEALLIVFALVATGAAGLMLVPVDLMDRPLVTEQHVRPKRLRVVLVTAGVGLVAGFIGAGGAFLLVPLLLVVVGIPIRVTIGSSLAITSLAAVAGVVGKLATGQIPYAAAAAVALGAVPGAQFGAAVAARLPGERLRLLLLAVIVISAARLWWDVLSR